jgi:hypothetical protein
MSAETETTKNANDSDSDSDSDFDIPDELNQKMRRDLTENLLKLSEGKEAEIKNIKSNVCEIDYKYAVSSQTSLQNEAINQYISKGMEINASIRGDSGSLSYSRYKEDIGKINASFAMISQPKELQKKGCYYIVHRCISKKELNQKSVAYMSTSSKPFTTDGAFGNYCFKIYVPIETPVIVGVLKTHFDKDNKQIYEIVFPMGTKLVPMHGTNNNSDDPYNIGEYYVDNSPSPKKGGNDQRKKDTRIRRTKKINTKKKIRRRGKSNSNKSRKNKKTRRPKTMNKRLV